jgi:hypothetical protein
MTNNLIDLDYANNSFELHNTTIWDIENNEKKQLIEYIDNIISTKFEKKITEQNDIIINLNEENKLLKETLNNLLFDLVKCNVFGKQTGFGLEKYHNNIIASNQVIEIDYIDYDFVSTELKKFYSSSCVIEGGKVSGLVEKDITNIKDIVKKIYLNPNDISDLDFTDKILSGYGPSMLPFYFQKFVNTINMRREYFQINNNGTRLIIFVTDINEERKIIEQYPNIQLTFIPNVKFKKSHY